jgi:hypothetical protein
VAPDETDLAADPLSTDPLSTDPLSTDPLSTDPLSTDTGWGRWKVPMWILVGGAVVAGVVLRFVTRSPLWLDESLSVNIARLPIGDIPEALRHDGHPPLYYVLLHAWMAVVGDGDVAVRAFSGLWSVALLPLVWVAGARVGGRRVAIYAVALVALSPYAIRYGTETRMYAMVSVVALAGWLLVDDALRRPRPARLVGVAVAVAVLVWSHYWAMWLLASGAVALVVHGWRARREDRPDAVRATVAVLGAFVVGGLTLLPWLPSMASQAAHTGTPWARPMRPTEMVVSTVADFGGGIQAEAVLLGWLLVIAVLVGLTGEAVGRMAIRLDLHTRRRARPFAVLVAGTIAIACAVGYATGATYASRYASVFFPFVMILAALGLDQIRSRAAVATVLGALLVLGGIGGVRNVITDRTDARRSVEAIEAKGEAGDWVVYCPDQLGPSGSRLLRAGFRQVTYPRFAPPQRVDWVDYKERLAQASPEEFATELLRRAGDRRIFLVYSTAYDTHTATCPALFNALGRQRPPEVLTQATEAFEPSAAVLFAPTS